MKCMATQIISLVAVCLLFEVQLGLTLYFKPEWHQYVMSLIRDHEKCAFLPVVISNVRHQNAEGSDYNDFNALFLPEVIIWDPVLQFLKIFNDL